MTDPREPSVQRSSYGVSHRLVDAVAALDPLPRTRRWSSLSYCVLDAVWSIGSRYDSVTAKAVRAVARAVGDEEPVVDAQGWSPITAVDPLPPERLLAAFDVQSLVDISNRQRTSPRGGILKADAALRFARILVNHGVRTIGDAARALERPGLLTAVDHELSTIPGDGKHGIRRSYFWMLVGDETTIKPDRMVLRWLAAEGVHVDPTGARAIVGDVTEALRARPGFEAVTPWAVDHAIWKAQRDRTRRARRRGAAT